MASPQQSLPSLIHSSPPPHTASSLSPSSNQCPICLDPITHEGYLDICFHKFCFHCIFQWAEMVFAHFPEAKQQLLDCPLCKTKSRFIIHNLVGETFDRLDLSCAVPEESKFHLTDAHARRLAVYYDRFGKRVSRDELGENVMNEFERNSSKNIKIFKGSSTILGYPTRMEQLYRWIRRDLQALRREEDVDLLLYHVVGILQHFNRETRKGVSQSRLSKGPLSWKKSVADAVTPFLGDNSQVFSVELEKFLVAGLSFEAYDRLHLGVDEPRSERSDC